MATPGHSKASRAYLDWTRFTQFVGSYNADFARDTSEGPTIEGDAKEFEPGKFGWTAATNGWMDVADDGWDEVEFAMSDTDQHIYCICPQGNTITSIAYDGEVQSTGQGRPFDQANIVMLNDTWQGDGAVFRGKVGTTGEKAFTGAASDTGVNHGATTTETMVAYLRCTAFSGFTNITFRIQESANDGSPDAYAQITGLTITVAGSASAGTDEVTFTGLGWAKFTITGATEAWKRLTCSAVTGTGSASVIMTLGLAATT